MDYVTQKIAEIVANLFAQHVEPELERTKPEFGDYACNVALRIGRDVGKSPRDVAEKIATQLRDVKDITDVTVAGPGFLNIKVSDEALVSGISEDVQYNDTSTVVIETNNPNPFKAMHIGHAYNAIVADTIANLIDKSGADVHRVSYHGDVGAHVGKSMYSILKFIDGDIGKLDKIKPKDRNSFMSQMYAEGARAFKEDPEAKVQIDKLSAESFTLKDPIYKKVYETCKQWSFEQIDDLVARLGNQPIEKRYLESQADKLGVETVKAHVGDVFIESDGALLFPGEKYGFFDNVFVSSNGRGLYGARDLGLMQLKQRDYNPAKSYIVTGKEQKAYFEGVIKAAELCLPAVKDVTVNISTGLVKLTTGKMSSRTGDVVEVAWLFDQISEAIKKAGNKPREEVITAAIRYQFLKNRIGSDTVFDIKESAQLQGNTGPYLQYAYARAASIMTKVASVTSSHIDNLEDDEHQLLLKISDYSLALKRAINERMPHYIATYLYELTQEFNGFYERNRVIGHDRESMRLQLLEWYMKTLEDGLQILGIPVLKKM